MKLVRENINFERGLEPSDSLEIGRTAYGREIFPPFDDIDNWPAGYYLIKRDQGYNLLKAIKYDGKLKFTEIGGLFTKVDVNFGHWKELLNYHPEEVHTRPFGSFQWLKNNMLTFEELKKEVMGGKIISIKRVGGKS